MQRNTSEGRYRRFGSIAVVLIACAVVVAAVGSVAAAGPDVVPAAAETTADRAVAGPVGWEAADGSPAGDENRTTGEAKPTVEPTVEPAATGGAKRAIGASTAAADGDRIDVVIRFESFAARRDAKLSGPAVDVTGGHGVDFLPVLFASVRRSAIPSLEARPDVAGVTVDRQVRLPPDAGRSNVTKSVRGSGTVGAADAQTVPWGVERIDGRDAAGQVSAGDQDDVVVAVLDTGVDHTHPQLDDNVAWGANFSGGVSQYGVATAADDQGHGTNAAGIVAAEDDGQGVVGVAPNATLYAIKVLDGSGHGRTSWIIRGIDAALKGPDRTLGTDDDADILSMSLGGPTADPQLQSAIENATDDAVVVAAAGNSGDGDPATDEVGYPAGYPETIAVAATDPDDETTRFSAEGAAVDVAAPGLSVETTAMDGGTQLFSGTSAAAPHVSGAVALVLADDLSDGSRDLSNADVDQRLADTAIDVEEPGEDNFSGHGLIQADNAVANEPFVGVAGDVVNDQGDPLYGARVDLYELHADGSETHVANTTASVGGSYAFADLEAGSSYRIEAHFDNRTGSVSVSSIGTGTTVRNVTVVGASPPPGNDQYEPNDDFASAAALAPPVDASGLRIVGTDQDFFAVELTRGDHLNASIEFGHSQANLDLYLLAPNQDLLDASTSITDDESVSARTTQNGTHYLLVDAWDDRDAHYDLSVRRQNGTLPSNDGYEPNDDFGSAAPLTPPLLAGGLQITLGDEDYFAVDLDRGDPLNVSIAFDHDDADLDLYVYDPNENVVDRSISITDDESVSVQAAEAGTHYVYVYAFDGERAEYTLSLVGAGSSTAEVFGQVTDADGDPIGGASVELRDAATSAVVATATTDAGGSYEVEVQPGDYTVVADAAGYDPGQTSVSVAAGDRTAANVQLVPSGPDADRDLSRYRAEPGEDVTVTVEATVQSSQVSITEAFQPAFGAATVENVTVDGQEVSPAVAVADPNGVVVTLSSVPAGSDVTVRYAVTIPGSAANGTTFEITGNVTTNGTSSPGPTELTVGPGSPLSGVAGRYDADADGDISIGELGAAAADYATGAITIAELGTVASVYAQS